MSLSRKIVAVAQAIGSDIITTQRLVSITRRNRTDGAEAMAERIISEDWAIIGPDGKIAVSGHGSDCVYSAKIDADDKLGSWIETDPHYRRYRVAKIRIVEVVHSPKESDRKAR